MDQLPPEPPSSEITPFDTYVRRRELTRRSLLFAGTSLAWGGALYLLSRRGRGDKPTPPPMVGNPAAWRIVSKESYGLTDPQNSFEDITTYNNYYELGLDKGTPSRLGHLIKTRPWTVRVTGEVEKPLQLDIDTLIGWFGLHERVYRMRCVEAWSMVVPWLGLPLGEFIKRVKPTSRAKFVSFVTLEDSKQLPGLENDILPWPYVEALRIDEAVHPLSLLAVGLYGAPLPGQNGAPLRLVVPWKYGFKGGKSIVEIRFSTLQPPTTWNRAAPSEYGFYANVNPNVDHPRWSQATERRIGELSRRATLMFNGYADQVGSLYSRLDLEKHF